MMKKLFYLGTLAFWLAVAAVWQGSERLPPPPPAPVAAPEPVEKPIRLAEVARHKRGDDCWMAINGQVYDLSGYIPEHPARPAVILPSCGRDATQAYRTKNKGRAHSPDADALLATFRLGPLDTAP